ARATTRAGGPFTARRVTRAASSRSGTTVWRLEANPALDTTSPIGCSDRGRVSVAGVTPRTTPDSFLTCAPTGSESILAVTVGERGAMTGAPVGAEADAGTGKRVAAIAADPDVSRVGGAPEDDPAGPGARPPIAEGVWLGSSGFRCDSMTTTAAVAKVIP